jgi:hypothetical protein
VPLRRHRSSLGPEHPGGRVLRCRLGDDVIREGERCPEVLAGCPGSVLRKGWRRVENQVSLFDEVPEGVKRIAVYWHASSVRRIAPEGKPSTFFVNAHFHQYRLTNVDLPGVF